MKIYVNGEVTTVAPGATVEDVVRAWGINDPRGVAVAVDGEVVRSGVWRDVSLSEGRKVEILRAVQGGAV